MLVSWAMGREWTSAGAWTGTPGSDGRVLVVDGYLRASGDSGWGATSASIDRRQITRWARRRGWRLGRLVEEPESAGAGETPARLAEALARIESQESDGLVVARLNQIGGSLQEALTAIERIEAAGGTFVSVRDRIDLSTPGGRLIFRVLLSVQDW